MANTLSLQVPNYYYGTARERTSHEENLSKISKSKIYWEGSYFGYFINLMTSSRHDDVINDKLNFPDCVMRCHGHTVKISSLNDEYIKSYSKCCFRGGQFWPPVNLKISQLQWHLTRLRNRNFWLDFLFLCFLRVVLITCKIWAMRLMT